MKSLVMCKKKKKECPNDSYAELKAMGKTALQVYSLEEAGSCRL